MWCVQDHTGSLGILTTWEEKRNRTYITLFNNAPLHQLPKVAPFQVLYSFNGFTRAWNDLFSMWSKAGGNEPRRPPSDTPSLSRCPCQALFSPSPTQNEVSSSPSWLSMTVAGTHCLLFDHWICFSTCRPALVFSPAFWQQESSWVQENKTVAFERLLTLVRSLLIQD